MQGISQHESVAISSLQSGVQAQHTVRFRGRGVAAGCTHFIIGRDMAGCKSTLTGEDFYGAYDAQDNAKTHAKELGMDTVPSLNITYTEVRLLSVLVATGFWSVQSPSTPVLRKQLHLLGQSGQGGREMLNEVVG